MANLATLSLFFRMCIEGTWRFENSKLVATINEGNRPAGSYTATFNAGNLATGLYIYALYVDNRMLSSNKMLLIK